MTDPVRATEGVVSSGWCVLRAPLLPIDELERWADQSATSPRSALPVILLDADVREAVYLASPGLESHIPTDISTTVDSGAVTSLIRYVLRMTGRTTPFGLFATCSLGRVTERTSFGIGPRSAIRRRTRLDMGLVTELAAALQTDDSVRGRQTVWPNATLHTMGDRVRYVEHRQDVDGRRTYHLVSAVASRPLLDALAEATTGVTIPALTRSLVDSGHPPDDAVRFVDALVDAQILTTGLEPPVTGGDPVLHLVGELGEDHAAGHTLLRVRDMLSAIDQKGVGSPPASYREVESAIDGLAGDPGDGLRFQVDAVRPPSVTIGAEIVDAVRDGVELLHRIGRPWRDAGLDHFRGEFIRRFGDRWVPLLVALDEEAGIEWAAHPGRRGAPAPLLDGIPDTVRTHPGVHRWGPREDSLLRLLHDAWTTGATEIELRETDVAALTSGTAVPLPDAFAAICSIAATSDAAADSGDFQIVLDGAAGPSGVRLVARFAELDPDLETAIRAHVRAEESASPSLLFAEVAHLPQGRLGNVVQRPVLRQAEIPVVGRSGAAPENQIPLHDLEVTVADGTIRLRSRTLDREVLPRISNAHDYYAAGNCAVYTFLGALQNEGTSGSLRWDWEPFEDAPFLPRVRSGRVVLARARWNVTGDTLLGLRNPERNHIAHERVDALRRRLGMPRFVHLAGGEGDILTDLDNPHATAAVLDLAMKEGRATFVEMLPEPGRLAAHGPEGRFVHELIVPFHRAHERLRAPLPPPDGSGDHRPFPQGSEWLYHKVYCDPSDMDRLLSGPIADLARTCVEEGHVDRWFFVRYDDPRPHLRIRFHGDPGPVAERVRPRVESVLSGELDAGRVHDIVTAVYRPEIRRYGGPAGMALAEQIFHTDSEAVMELLPVVVGAESETLRWEMALIGADQTLAALGLDTAERTGLLRRVRASLERRLDVDGPTRAQVMDALRPHRARLLRLLEGTQDGPFGGGDDPESGLVSSLRILERRAVRLRRHGMSLRRLADEGSLTTPLDDFAWSVAHMFLNRLLRDAHLRQEMVLSAFLDRLHDSMEARRRH